MSSGISLGKRHSRPVGFPLGPVYENVTYQDLAHGSCRKPCPNSRNQLRIFVSSRNPYSLAVHKNQFARSFIQKVEKPTTTCDSVCDCNRRNNLKRIFLLRASSIAHMHSLNWTVPISCANVNEYYLE